MTTAILKRYRICERHFSQVDVKESGKRKLLTKTAIPFVYESNYENEMSDEEKAMSTDSDDALSSSDEEEKELENRAKILEGELTNNKYLYEAHVEVVAIYRKSGDIKSMRAAYNRFSEYFPLTSKIWLSWIKDEVKLATSPSEKKNVLSLFQRAVKDYLSVDIWLEYVQFSIGNCEMEETYKILEQGLSTAGLHTNQGSLLWDLLRELELSQLSLHEVSTDKWNQQAAKVIEAFKRQLSVPLLQMENTYLEWTQWIEQLPDDYKLDRKPVEWGYQQALKLLRVYEPFEEQLLTTEDDTTLYSVYKEYIKVTTNPVTAICLYERAVAQLSLNTCLWCDYCLFMLNLGDLTCDVSQKALRNCSWNEELWIIRMRTLEYQQCNEDAVMQCLEQGLAAIVPSPGLNLWLSYIEYIRRCANSTEKLHKIIKQAADNLGESGDPSFKLLRLQARLYARAGNIVESRRIWLNILSHFSHKELASVWLEFIALEKQYGDEVQLRKLYKQAITKCTDWPQYIAEDWIMYERECGTLKDMLKCLELCKNVTEEPILTSTLEHKNNSTKRSHENDSTNHSKSKRQKTSEETKVIKKKVNVSDINTEKSVFLSNMREDIDEDRLSKTFPTATKICIPTDRKGTSRCFAYVEFNNEDDVQKALERDREKLNGRPLYISKCMLDQTQRKPVFKYATHGEENKLFVRGLPKRFSQGDVENLFKPHGCTAVRIVLHRSGQSKGLAYVDFIDKNAAEAAIKAMDQLDVEGHTITVAVSEPPQRKQSNELEYLAPTRHSRSRIQIPLVPRPVQVKGIDSGVPGSSKTNEDFRKMLFSKKN
ncbi:hypothetical protein RN001_000979 [Aquatica leii]|uniref:RRM domain-containing protein n=1 Tax=Aquatica leii TaxID=1421715 RepID=A0AAN7PFW9_9COLE|nr:hypothetical protein RN001_000979 [Aquatica leii]